MRRGHAALVVLAGCGRFEFAATIDAAPDQAQDAALSAVSQTAYVKASNPRMGASFGIGLAMSSDGNTLAVGSPDESSGAMGINGDDSDTSAPLAGAAYVFVRAGGAWVQQAYVKPPDTAMGDNFGQSVALSADGSTLAVGSYLDNNGFGAVYVYTRVGTTWSFDSKIVAANPDLDDRFGDRVTLSADGSLLATSAYFESSDARGVNGDETNNLATDSGAVYVFARGTPWTQQAYLKASNADPSDLFGYSLAFSGDGTLLAVGAEDEASAGPEADNSAPRAGAVYMFQRSGTTWSQQAYIKASNAATTALFGINLALSSDGSTLAVGAIGEESGATGIDGIQADTSATNSGAVYVFTHGGASWTQQAYVKASNAEADDLFGAGIALSADGSTMVVGAIGESSSSPGVDAVQTDNLRPDAGAGYVFIRSGGTWAQTAYLKTSNPGVDDELGLRAVLSGDGGTLAICAYQEGSGTPGNELDDSAANAGAVYIFE